MMHVDCVEKRQLISEVDVDADQLSMEDCKPAYINTAPKKPTKTLQKFFKEHCEHLFVAPYSRGMLHSYKPLSTESPEEARLNYLMMIEDRMGMTITSGSVALEKDENNLIGISIGGGAPLCPCLYVVQVFDNTAASQDGILQAGDEIIGVCGTSVKGRTKVEVAKTIQAVKGLVTINYNKLHADPKQGKCLDIILKKVKHRIVESMSSTTADALGLSRAILCNDSLIKKLDELQKNEFLYKGLMEHSKRVLKAFYDLSRVHKEFGDAFASIGVREPQPRASEAFTTFGESHRNVEKSGLHYLKTIKPMLSDLGTYITKAIPDTRLTIKKYADAKFEYLSYCLKVKEMDDEEYSYAALQEPLYRVETGNYEYRLILRCRQEQRAKFAKLRSDVLVKIELLDQKHVQDIVHQLQRLVSALARYHNVSRDHMKVADIFPIEVDLSRSSCHQENNYEGGDEDDEDDDELIHAAEEATESNEHVLNNQDEMNLLGDDFDKLLSG